MKRLLIALLVIASAHASEQSDRDAIDRTLAYLNTTIVRSDSDLFTFDAAAKDFPALERLWKAHPPSATFSHGVPVLKIPKISRSSTRFIAADVALVDAVYTDGGESLATPLVFVMQKKGDAWKIAALRVGGTGTNSN